MSVSTISFEKLYTAEDDFLVQKFKDLKAKQELERLKEKELAHRKNRTHKKAPTIITNPSAFRVTTDASVNRQREAVNFAEGSISRVLPQNPMGVAETNSNGFYTPKANDFTAIRENSNANLLEASSAGLQTGMENPLKSPLLKKLIKSVDRVNEIVTKTQNRYKLKTATKELKFNEKIKEFKKLDTFFNVKSLLQQINLTNNISVHEKKPAAPGFLPLLEQESENYNDEDQMFTDDNELFGIKTNASIRRGMQILEMRRKLTEANVTEEDIERKLQFSERITSYIKKNMRRDFDVGFERTLLDNFEKNELIYLQSKKNRAEKYSLSQEIQLRHLEKFVENKLQENILKKQLQNGQYLDKYREQSTKVLELLKKTTKNIYSNKVLKINQALMEKNRKIKSKNRESRSPLTLDDFEIAPDKTRSNFRKSVMFLTEHTHIVPINKEKGFQTVRNHRGSASMNGVLPVLTTKTETIIKKTGKRENKRNEFLETRMDNLKIQRKMQDFINNCEQTKSRIMLEKENDLKEIERVQNTIDNGLEQLKGNRNVADSLKLTIGKGPSLNMKYKKNKRGSYMSVGSIVGLI